MHITYTVLEASSRLGELIEAVEGGEQVTITRNGKPVVDLVPSKHSGPRKFGTMKGLVIDPDWNRPQNDVEAWLRGDV
ncbi:MAG: type II toxin-antitoxin system prevent-host-death family antitoxin [Acidobacteriaceae bacterium]|nr:type II toxin-antitoxin system prevent-host-death family antitoxin [Acidobacteriaceae bacterium]MBV9039288.1 type II toxin-antitoxin system prevent-host-death family antitoxin [Acidobacteriaceae bacterium]MBV9937307.1 type II toxin-antitoxin system prevent-host-death family antitoxin [Acidobacteriaceae bacterium]